MKLFGKKFFAYLLVALIVLTSIPMTAFADGDTTPTGSKYPMGVVVRHYNVADFPYIGDAEKWIEHSLDSPNEGLYFKVAAPGDGNNIPLDGTYAFANDWYATNNKDAQKIFGYITPDQDLDNLIVRTDDGARLYIDTDQDGVLEEVLDSYTTQGSTNHSVAGVTLEEQQTYRFELHYFNWGGGGALQLMNGEIALSEELFSVNPVPAVTANDDENKIVGANGMMEISVDGGSTWSQYNSEANNFPNNLTVKVRYIEAYDNNDDMPVLPYNGREVVDLVFTQPYDVTFNSNGGSSVSAKTGIVGGSVVGSLETPTYPGYDFLGWWTGDSQVTSETIVNSSFEAIAKWTPSAAAFDETPRPVRTVVVEETPAPQAVPVVAAPVVAPTPAAPPATEAVVDVPTAVVPLAVVTLPKTGEIPATLFYGLGGLLGGIGVFMRRKK